MMRDLAKACDMLLGLPKSLLFNLHYFGLAGLRLPVLLSWRVRLERLSGRVFLARHRFGTVRLGLQTCDGELMLGNGMDINAGAHVFCASRVEVGDGGLWAWNVVVTDHDFHHIEDGSGAIVNMPRPVTLREHIWIGANACVLKGSGVGADTVIGAASVVSGRFDEAHCVLAGNPARVVKRGTHWRH